MYAHADAHDEQARAGRGRRSWRSALSCARHAASRPRRAPCRARSAAAARPSAGSGCCTDVAVTMIAAVIGRNASPVWIGEKPLVLLQEVREEQEDARTSRCPEMPIARKAPAAGAVAHDAQRQQRMLDARSIEHERDEQHDGGGERDDRHRGRPGVRLGVREAEDEREQAGCREQRRRRGRGAGGSAAARLTSSRSAPIAAGIANSRFTYRHQRQDRHSVRMPPSSRPTAAPPPAIAPKMPNALARSAGVGEGRGQQGRARTGRAARRTRPGARGRRRARRTTRRRRRWPRRSRSRAGRR